jgi:hypothetical protein
MASISGRGNPGGLVRAAGTTYTDLTNGQVYIQGNSPFGSNWTLLDTNSGDDLTTGVNNLQAFDDDTAASGLTSGTFYQTTGGGAAPLDVPGIVMIKQ